MALDGKQIKNSSIPANRLDPAFTSTLILVDGSRAFIADQSMGGYKLTNVAAPTLSTDAANRQYVDTVVSGRVLRAGDTMTGFLTLVANPTSNLHAATKLYVDTADNLRLKKDGTTPLTANWDIGGFKLTNAADPSNPQDYVTKAYGDANYMGGSTVPGGSNTNVQYNNSGSFGGDAGLTWNGSTLTATAFSGDGSSISNLNATSITSGTIGDVYLSANVTVQGNVFNGINQLVQLDGSGKLPAIDGSQLTNLPSTGVAGSDTWVQYNDGGAFGADLNFTWNKTTHNLTLASFANDGGIGINGTPTYALDVAPRSSDANMVRFLGTVSGLTGTYILKTDSLQLKIDNGSEYSEIASTYQSLNFNLVGTAASVGTVYDVLMVPGTETLVTDSGKTAVFGINVINSNMRVVNGMSIGRVQCNESAALIAAEGGSGNVWAVVTTVGGAQEFFLNSSNVAAGSVFFANVFNNRIGIKNITPNYELDVNGEVRVIGSNKLWFGGTTSSADGKVAFYYGTCSGIDYITSDDRLQILNAGVSTCADPCGAAIYAVGDIYSASGVRGCEVQCCCPSPTHGFVTSSGYHGVTGLVVIAGHTIQVQDGIVVQLT